MKAFSLSLITAAVAAVGCNAPVEEDPAAAGGQSSGAVTQPGAPPSTSSGVDTRDLIAAGKLTNQINLFGDSKLAAFCATRVEAGGQVTFMPALTIKFQPNGPRSHLGRFIESRTTNEPTLTGTVTEVVESENRVVQTITGGQLLLTNDTVKNVQRVIYQSPPNAEKFWMTESVTIETTDRKQQTFGRCFIGSAVRDLPMP